MIRFLGACFSPPDYLIVMEYAERGTLHAVLAAHRNDITPKMRLAMLLVLSSDGESLTVAGYCTRHVASTHQSTTDNTS